MSARLKLISQGYDGEKQSVRGYLADAAQLAQLLTDEPRGMTHAETSHIRDLLVAALEVMDEEVVQAREYRASLTEKRRVR